MEDLFERIDRLEGLQKLPPIIGQINQLLDDPNVGIPALASEISRDLNVTSRLLKLANSSFYGFPGTISTVSQALVIMGIEAVRGLITASEIYERLPESYQYLLEHSMLAARASRKLADQLNTSKAEEVATAGLLHDIGKAVLLLEKKLNYGQLLAKHTKDKNLLKLENQSYGFDHSQVGFRICSRWHLPDRLSFPILYHHAPEKALEFVRETRIIATANQIVHISQQESKERKEPAAIQSLLDQPGYNELGLNALACEQICLELQTIQKSILN